MSCDIALVSPDQIPSDDEAAQEYFPPASELVYLRVAPLPWIKALSEALEQSEVPHRVDPGSATDPPEGQRPEVFGDVDLFGLYVLPADEERARELDSLIAVQVLPEEAEDLAEVKYTPPCCAATVASSMSSSVDA